MSDPATSADIALVVKEVHGVHNDIVYQNSLTCAKLDVLHADMQAVLKALAAGPASTAPAASSAAPTDAAASVAPVDPIAAKYFPDNIGLAAFPSPENSSVIRLGTLITGRPYLRDSAGSVHQMIAPTASVPNGYTVNGAFAQGGGSDQSPVGELLVREGMVYAKTSGGIWQSFHNGSLYSASLPDPFATDATGATTSTVATSSVKAPTLPAPMSPAPGTSGKTLTVGPGKAFTTITDAVKAAAAGDTIAIDAGTYKETPPALTVPLHVIGMGGQALLDCTGLTGSLAYGKGCFVPTADCILENIGATGVAMDQDGAQLTSGVRPDTGCGYLTLKNVELFGNQSGLGTGGDLVVSVVVDGGHFHKNGLVAPNSGNGYTHNIYCGAQTSLTLKNGFVSDNPTGGHAVKSRGYELIVQGGTYEATDAAVFDIPQGTVAQAVIDGATMTKPAGSANHAVIDYATENTDSGNGGLLLKNCTLNWLCDNPFYNVGGGSIITLDASNKVTGTKATATGGKVVGL